MLAKSTVQKPHVVPSRLTPPHWEHVRQQEFEPEEISCVCRVAMQSQLHGSNAVNQLLLTIVFLIASTAEEDSFAVDTSD